VVEAQAEFQNTLVATKNFAVDPSPAAHEELLVRFDVFWSRVPLILDSDEGVDVRRIDALPALRSVMPPRPSRLSAGSPRCRRRSRR
jgi:hypothetical protein